MNIYRKKHTPYTYLIGWSWLDIWYYGRRTKRGCHPDDFWVSYWTSSKEVELYRELHGEPDIIIIKKTFESHEIDKCALWEHKVLRRLDAARHPKMLNKRNGDAKWDTTGTCPAILVSTGKRLGNVSLLDLRWKTGEIVHPHKGKTPAILVSTGENLGPISVSDPRWETGEIQSLNKGKKHSEEVKNGARLRMSGTKRPLTGKKISKALKGVPKSEEHKKNLRKPGRGLGKKKSSQHISHLKETQQKQKEDGTNPNYRKVCCLITRKEYPITVFIRMCKRTDRLSN